MSNPVDPKNASRKDLLNTIMTFENVLDSRLIKQFKVYFDKHPNKIWEEVDGVKTCLKPTDSLLGLYDKLDKLMVEKINEFGEKFTYVGDVLKDAEGFIVERYGGNGKPQHIDLGAAESDTGYRKLVIMIVLGCEGENQIVFDYQGRKHNFGVGDLIIFPCDPYHPYEIRGENLILATNWII